MGRRLRERTRAPGALKELYPDLSNETLGEVSESEYGDSTSPAPIIELSSLDEDYAPSDASGVKSQDGDSDSNAAADAAREVTKLSISDAFRDDEGKDEDEGGNENDTFAPQDLVRNVDENVSIAQLPLPVPDPNAAMITSRLPKYPWLDIPGTTKTLVHKKYPFLDAIHDATVSIAQGKATATAQGATSAAGGSTTAGLMPRATQIGQSDGAVDFAANTGDSLPLILAKRNPPGPVS